MVLFVLRTKTLQNQDGFLDGRSFHFDALKAAFQGGVLLDVLPVLVKGGGADALHLAAAKGWLDDVGRIHGSLSGTGPNDGVQFVDEKNDILGPANFVHHRLNGLLELAAVLGACNHQSEVQSDDALIAEEFGNIAFGDFLSQTFDNGGLAHACLAEQHRVVLGPAAEDLNDALDFALPTNDGIHFAFAGDFGEVAAKRLESGSFDFTLLFRRFFAAAFLRSGRLLFLSVEIGIKFLEDLLPGLLDIHVEILEDASGDSVTFPKEAEQNMFGAHVSMIEGLGFLGGKCEDLLHPRGVRNIADHFLIGASADLFFDLHADSLKVEAKFLQDINGHALAQFDETQEEMFGAHEVVVKPVSLFARQREHLLGSRGKIIHRFVAHTFLNKCIGPTFCPVFHLLDHFSGRRKGKTGTRKPNLLLL